MMSARAMRERLRHVQCAYARMGLAAGLVLAPLGCGYRSLASAPAAETLAVVSAGRSAVDAMTEGEVLAGVRAALAEEGAGRSGSDYPRLEVEVVADDFGGAGVVAREGLPRAQATEVRVLARARLRRAADVPAAWESGDVSAFATVSVTSRDELTHAQIAVRSAAREAGRVLALRALGDPAASAFRLTPEPRR